MKKIDYDTQQWILVGFAIALIICAIIGTRIVTGAWLWPAPAVQQVR